MPTAHPRCRLPEGLPDPTAGHFIPQVDSSPGGERHLELTPIPVAGGPQNPGLAATSQAEGWSRRPSVGAESNPRQDRESPRAPGPLSPGHSPLRG